MLATRIAGGGVVCRGTLASPWLCVGAVCNRTSALWDKWTRAVESHHLLAGLQPAARLASYARACWRPQRESNPHSLIDNQASWPLDDRSVLMDPRGVEPLSSACEADALPLSDRPMVAGEGIAPPCKAYEAWLDLSPV